MTIYWLVPFWFDEVFYKDNEVHKNYFTIDLPTVNIYATIGLTIFSPGLDLSNQVAGLAASGVRAYEFIDQQGKKQKKVIEGNWQSHLYVEKCVSITFAFYVQKAWAKAEGMIYYYQ